LPTSNTASGTEEILKETKSALETTTEALTTITSFVEAVPAPLSVTLGKYINYVYQWFIPVHKC
jgi:hypothetical protein